MLFHVLYKLLLPDLHTGFSGGSKVVWYCDNCIDFPLFIKYVKLQLFFSVKPTLLPSVQLLSCVQIFATPWTAAHQASLSFTISQSLLKFMSIESVMSSSQSHTLLPLLLLPSVFPSMRVFSSESVLRIRCPEYWSFSFSISPSDEYSGLISFRIDWLNLLAVQGTLK